MTTIKTAQILGLWESTGAENIEGYMRALGFDFLKRKLASRMKPTLIYSVQDNGKITEKTVTSFLTMEMTFELGVEFEFLVPIEKKKSKNLITIEGNQLIHKVTYNGMDTLTVRTFNGNEMVATHKAGDQVATRTFRKAQGQHSGNINRRKSIFNFDLTHT